MFVKKDDSYTVDERLHLIESLEVEKVGLLSRIRCITVMIEALQDANEKERGNVGYNCKR